MNYPPVKNHSHHFYDAECGLCVRKAEHFQKHGKMTAKEFLREFSLWIEIGGLVEENPNRTEQDWEDQIDSFLEEFHAANPENFSA